MLTRTDNRTPLASCVCQLLLLAFALLPGCSEPPTAKSLRLATTTSTRDSGLLDELLPTFERQHGVRVDVIAVGTGKALKLGEAGDADVVLVHAREAEDAFMAAGHGVRREDVMSNTFELLGPQDDPAEIRGEEVGAALQRIAGGVFRFVSRGDDSGTHRRELALWRQSGGRPEWDDYIEAGQGMGATLVMADQMQAYVLADRGTYLRFKEKIDLEPLADQSDALMNPYGVMTVNPDKHSAVRAELGEALVDYLISPEVQADIAAFRIEGEPLFIPSYRANGK